MCLICPALLYVSSIRRTSISKSCDVEFGAGAGSYGLSFLNGVRSDIEMTSPKFWELLPLQPTPPTHTLSHNLSVLSSALGTPSQCWRHISIAPYIASAAARLSPTVALLIISKMMPTFRGRRTQFTRTSAHLNISCKKHQSCDRETSSCNNLSTEWMMPPYCGARLPPSSRDMA